MAADRANQLVEAGLCLQLAGDLTGAAKIWEEALRLDPANVRAKRCLQALNEKAIRPAASASMGDELKISSLGAPLGGGGGQIPNIANAQAFRTKNPFERPAHVAGNSLTPGPFALLDGTPPPSPMPPQAPAATKPQPSPAAVESSRPLHPQKPASKRRTPFERPPAADPARPLAPSSYEALLRTAGVEPAAPAPQPAPSAGASFQALLASAAGAEGDKPIAPIRLTEAAAEPKRAAPVAAQLPVRAEEPPAAASQVDVLLQGVRDLLDLDDHTGAHDTIEKILAIDPENAAARELLRKNEATLLAMYDSKIGDLTHRPKVQLRADEIVWLNIDHRAGFLLSMIDGTVSYDDLFALSSMSRLDTARILCQLLGENVIA